MSKQKEDQPEINEEEEEVEAVESPVKKGRGRPKSTKAAAKPKDTGTPKRGRGRPAAVKDDSDGDASGDVVEDAGEPPAKKGRGRPRTKPQSAKPAKDPNAPKRGRGRPPKQAKGRGRPPKVAAPVEDNEEEDEATE